jgi:hypothetical protein
MQTINQQREVIAVAVRLLQTSYNILNLPIENILDSEFNVKFPLVNIDYVGSSNNGYEVIRNYRVHFLKVQDKTDVDLNNIVSEVELDALTFAKQLDYTSQTELYNIDASAITPVRQFTTDYSAGVYIDISFTELNNVDLCPPIYIDNNVT